MSSGPPTPVLTVPGYRNIAAIFRSERTLVHSAVRIDGNVKVALKSVMPGTLDANARWRLLHEYKLLADLDIPHVVKAHALKNTELGITLELEHVGSSNLHILSSEVLAVKRVIEIALQMSTAVSALHDRDVSHRDINPSNVMYHRTSGQLWLIDFGLATNLARESAEALPSGRLEGTLGYLSPEQTGRMNRSVDRRTDFYGLGATIYQLLTNRPPFAIRDPMALLHATVALQPTHVCEIRAEIPRVLGDLVMRLLNKDAEQRYQSGAALVYDLERCAALLDDDGNIEPFELGVTDRRGTFLMPERLYGRELALTTIGHALDRSLAGVRSVVGLPGKAGVGKTALSRELLPQLKGNGLLAVGVCNPVRRSPYGPILEVFRAVTTTVLAGSSQDLIVHRERYDAAVEGHGSMLALLMPELSAIVGPLEPVPELPPSEVRERILRMLVRLLHAYHAPEHPLVVFLDDLQWADPGTIEVLDRFLESDVEGGPLMVLAWREDEIPAGHPFEKLLERSGDQIEQIQLGPLTEADVTELLCDALSLPEADVAPLSASVYEKTAGNAFFVGQFLTNLASEGVLQFDGEKRQWVWSVEAIDALPPTKNVGELLSLRLEALSVTARTVLGVAACVGKRFELSGLFEVAELSRTDLQSGLKEAVDAGLVLSHGDAWTELQGWSNQLDLEVGDQIPSAEFWFVHDTVFDASIALPPVEQRQAYHLRAGRRLLVAWRGDDTDPFAAADQFVQALALLVDTEEKREVAAVMLDAGKRAYGSAAFETALYYLEKGCDLIQRNDWTDSYELAFDLHILAAESLQMSPAYATSTDFAAVASKRARDVIDRVAVQRVRIRFHTGRYEFSDTIRLTLDALKSVGVTLPAMPHTGHVAWTLMRTYLRVWRLDLEKLRAIPNNEDKEVEAAMSLLMDAAAPSYYISSNLMPLILCKMVELSIVNGMSRTSAFGMAGFAFVEVMVRDNVPSATMWATFARELVERFDAKALAPKVEILARGMVQTRTDSLGSLIAPFRESAWMAKEVGDPEYTALCHFNSAFLTLLSGVPLPEAYVHCLEDLRVSEELAQSQATNAVRLVLQTIDCLRGNAPNPAVLSGDFMNLETMLADLREGGDLAGEHSVLMRKVFLTLLFGDNDTLIPLIEAATKGIGNSPGSPEIGAFHLHAALGWVARMRQVGHVGGRPWKQAKKHLKALQKWAKDGPANAAHKARLVEAELADLRDEIPEAMRLYEEAITLARASGMLHEEAICLEWSARASLRYGYHRNAAVLLREAKTAWKSYGCGPKLADLGGLEDAMPDIGTTISSTTNATMSMGSLSMNASHAMDMTSVIKASRAMSGEIEFTALLDQLMRVIIENAGATSGFLVLNRDDEQRVVATASTGEGEDVDIQVVDAETQQDPGAYYPDALSVVNYVTNTLEPLVLHDVGADGRFFQDTDDPPLSVLCVPSVKGNSLVGVMYLENRLARKAFSEDRHEIVSVLCSQAAVSIENALLYADLQDALGTQTALTNAYGRFMPPQFLSLLGHESILDLGLGDQVLRPITVMFADIRNFTGLAEAIGPANTFTFINRYLGFMEPAIHAHNGFVNQYLGDGIMALFPTSADDGVLGALAMLNAVRALNQDLTAAGETPVNIGIGLNSGPLMIGAIGGLDRMGRGIVGDATNVASRVEGMTKRYRVPLLIGESTFTALSAAQVTTRLVDRVMPKGREKAMSVYEVLEGANPAERQGKLSTLADYNRGVSHWSEGRFQEAEVYFNSCVDAFPRDTPAQLFAARCKHLGSR